MLSIHVKAAVSGTQGTHLFHIKLQSGTNEINKRHFLRIFLTNSSDGSFFTYLNNNLINSSGRDRTPTQRGKRLETTGSSRDQPAHKDWFLSPLLVSASLYLEDLGRHFLRRFPKIHIHFLPVSPPR